MKNENILLTVAVIAVVVSMAGLFITYDSINLIKQRITGFATETGQVNITIQSQASINITSAGGTGGSTIIDFGSGYVSTGQDYAILATNGTMFQGTSWNTVSEGFIVENIGNVNVTLGIKSTSNAAGFLGGSSPLYQYNVSNNKPGSCNFTTSGYAGDVYEEMTSSNVPICERFEPDSSSDQIRIDILLRVPSASNTGDLQQTVTLDYSEVV